jgi:hypothetical protein
MFTSILFATLFTAVSALQVDHPHANSSSSLDNDNGSRLRARQQSICGADDAIEAKCAKTNGFGGGAYYHSKAVLRISRNGRMLCTGWLVGNEGHIITAYHCLNDAQAATFNFEAMAEGPTCATNCKKSMSCPGKFFKDPVTFVATGGSIDNDWTVLKLSERDNNDARSLGLPRLKIRKSGAREGERIYTAGHPNGSGKRIGFHAPGGFATILGTFTRNGVKRVTYNVDTNGGASGSPVLAFEDHVVVALATSGGCVKNNQNEGVDGRALFRYARKDLPASCWVD